MSAELAAGLEECIGEITGFIAPLERLTAAEVERLRAAEARRSAVADRLETLKARAAAVE